MAKKIWTIAVFMAVTFGAGLVGAVDKTAKFMVKNLLVLLLHSLIAVTFFGCISEQPPLDDQSDQSSVAEIQEIEEVEEVAAPISITIQFAGDILLHGGLGAETGSNTYDYRPFFWAIAPHINANLAMANMETPVDVFGGNRQIASWPRFNAPFEILEGVTYAGFNHLVSANNHAFDLGFIGIQATLENFQRVGITQTGIYATEEEFNTPTIIDVEGIQIGVIAYTDSVNGLENLVPADIRPFTIRRFRSHVAHDVPAMAADIAAIQEAGAEVVIISLHWGAEYTNRPTDMQMQIARSLIDAGADIIMGHHSHTPQPLEWHYRADGTRGLIIYSLGNFLANQFALQIPATQYGMLVTAYITKTPQNTIVLDAATVLPTVFVRDVGRTLGSPFSILPVINGEIPGEITNEDFRALGRMAWAHMVNVVGLDWLVR